MSAARSESESRSVTRNASTPCSYVNSFTARVQSVPHMHRSMPNASNILPRGSYISAYGNGSCDSVQAPEILMATFSHSASESTLDRLPNGSGGAGGSNGCASPT